MYRKYLKRFLDIMGAIIGLIIASPVLLGVGLLLTVVNRGSPFFYQNRIGRDGKIFRIIKFKTMNDEKDESGKLLPDSIRTHTIGRVLRFASIDELPQIVNVLSGDMSFIGPRPLLERYLPYYSPEQATRHNVRPGITGWAQVNGRNAISWTQRFEFDVWYVSHLNFKLDLKIFWITMQKIVLHNGINADRDITMVPFDTYCRQSKLK